MLKTMSLKIFYNERKCYYIFGVSLSLLRFVIDEVVVRKAKSCSLEITLLAIRVYLSLLIGAIDRIIVHMRLVLLLIGRVILLLS